MKSTASTALRDDDNALGMASALKNQTVLEHYFSVADAGEKEFALWSKSPYWTVDEATALTLGKNPRLVNWAVVQPLMNTGDFVARYAELRDLILRAVHVGELAETTPPADFIQWIKPRFADFPAPLAQAVDRFTRSTEKPFSPSAFTREKNTLLLIIYAVAVERFGYQPGNNGAATKIMQCIENLGLDITHGTVLEKIRSGEQVAKERLAKPV